MDVFYPNNAFHFDKLTLTHPNSVAGGSYITRYSYCDSKQPLYIQTIKTRSKQGIVISGRKAHIDLLLTATDSDAEFTEWIANLEKRSVDLLYEKRHLWFTQELDRVDIENSFTSPIRAYKTGHFLLRVNLEPNPNRNFTHIQPFACKVFNENKTSMDVEYIKDTHTIISIIEFHGIRFTSRNFQLELFLRQVLVVPDIPLFETCVIAAPAPVPALAPAPAPAPAREDVHTEEPPTIPDIPESEHEYLDVTTSATTDAVAHVPIVTEENRIKHFDFTEVNIDFNSIGDLDTNEPTFQMEPREANPENQMTVTSVKTATGAAAAAATTAATAITLKKHKDVLFELYKVAKKKAVEAKKVAIRAYLEAKEIKANYMLDNSDLSDSESDDAR
jgi:hypothetical protein